MGDGGEIFVVGLYNLNDYSRLRHNYDRNNGEIIFFCKMNDLGITK